MNDRDWLLKNVLINYFFLKQALANFPLKSVGYNQFTLY